MCSMKWSKKNKKVLFLDVWATIYYTELIIWSEVRSAGVLFRSGRGKAAEMNIKQTISE